MQTLKRIPYTEGGLRDENLLRFIDEAGKRGLHSFMLLRRGDVLAEGWWQPYTRDFPHMLFSLSKSFTSTAIGFAVQEGLLTVEDHLVDFFPEYLPAAPCENMLKMRLKHLLTMSTGHLVEPSVLRRDPPQDWRRLFLESYVPEEPGTRFVYNTAATYMLSAVIQKVTGQTTFDYLKPRLFEPLGIHDIWWDSCPQGISVGGFGLNLHTEDIAKFGQFCLQKGMWDGQQLLDPAWIEDATAKHIDNFAEGMDWHSGYGYQFWRCARAGAYRGDGAYGQLCIVVPQKELVFACTANVTCTFQELTDLVFEELLIPIEDAPVASDPLTAWRVQDRLRNMSRPIPQGDFCTAAGAAVSGKRYVFGDNPLGIRALTFDFGSNQRVTMESADGTSIIPIGRGGWAYGETAAPEQRGVTAPFFRDIAAAGAWEDGVFHMSSYYPCTPMGDEWFLRFGKSGVELTIRRAGSMTGGVYSLVGLEA